MGNRLIINFDHADYGNGTRNTMTIEEFLNGQHITRTIEYVHSEKAPEPKLLDGCVLAIIFHAMKNDSEIKVNGSISRAAIRNFWHLGEAWRNMNPDLYSPVQIVAEQVIDQSSPTREPWAEALTNKEAVLAFSSGIDSHFSAIRHSSKKAGEIKENIFGTLQGPLESYPIHSAVLVHGFDVNYENTKDFAVLRKKAERNLKLLDIPLRVVRTNIRVNESEIWEHSFAAKLSSVLHQFSHLSNFGIIGSGQPYSRPLVSSGSQPGLDHLYSGSQMKIIHDGAGYSRPEKVALLSRYPDLLPGVRVCWEGKIESENCGKCEKCVKTRLNFMSVGEPWPALFDTPFDPEMIQGLNVSNQGQLLGLQNVIDYCKQNYKVTPEWLGLLETKVTQLRETLFHDSVELVKLNSLTAERDAVSAERDLILSSNSWKITKPLRRMGSIFRTSKK